MNRCTLFARLAPGIALCLLAKSAAAQFNPGPNPIDGVVTTPETLAGGTGMIDSDGTLMVSGSAVAITVTGSSSIINDGTIDQPGTGRGIRDNTGGLTLSVTNGSATNSSALIETADNDAFQMAKSNSNVTCDNYGSIISMNASAGGAQAIDWNAITTGSNTLNNYSTGFIEAFEADAVRPGVNGVITNSGTIKAITSTGSSSDGIDTQTNSGINITNSGSGLIEGGRHGITGGNTTTGVYAMMVTNNLGATIQGDNGSGINIDGINGSELVTIVNHGTITGNGHDIGDGMTHDGDGVDVDGLVNLTNSGTIKSLNAFGVGTIEASEGVTVGGGTVNNTGTIEGDVANGNTTAIGRGITFAGIDTSGTPAPIYGNCLVNNSGMIRGQSDSGVVVLGGASGFTVTINNETGGVIEGGGAAAAAIQTGADNDTVNDSGEIIADSSGKAVDLGGGVNALNILGGSATIIGDISGGSGTSSLTIDPGSGQSFSYSGSISNFVSAEIKSGTVTFSGASTYSGNTTISGGTFLAHNSAGSATGTGGVLVQNGGTLGGDGSVGGNVNNQSGGTISPGMKIGTLTIGGNLDITDGSKFTFELGPTSDMIAAGGMLAFTGSGHAIFNIVDAGIMAGNTYTLITFSSSSNLTLNNLAFGSTPPGFYGDFILTGDSLELHVETVPEPATMALLFATFAIGCLAFARRRSYGMAGA